VCLIEDWNRKLTLWSEMPLYSYEPFSLTDLPTVVKEQVFFRFVREAKVQADPHSNKQKKELAYLTFLTSAGQILVKLQTLKVLRPID